MSRTTIRSLAHVPFPQVHRAFSRAFADYLGGAGRTSEEALHDRVVKNGMVAELSAGAFVGDELVGLMLVGVGSLDGQPSAYDIATGIIPAHRGLGLAGRMVDFVVPLLRESGLATLVLEVVRDNEAAVRAYRASGFEVRRRFECFALAREAFIPRASAPDVRIATRDRGSISAAVEWMAYEPSWENGWQAIERIPSAVTVLAAESGDDCIGILVYYRMSGWILNVAVAPEVRRKGIGGRLVGALLDLTGEPKTIKLNNVPDTDTATCRFLEAIGFHRSLGQFEMVKPLAVGPTDGRTCR